MSIKTAALLASVMIMGGLSGASAATLSFKNVPTAATGHPLTVTGSDGNQITFTGDSATQFESVQQGGSDGQFAPSAYFLSAGLGDQGPITIDFATPVTSISLPVGLQQNFDYTVGLQLFDGNTLVKSFSPTSVAMVASGYAPATVFDFSGDITSAVIAITASSGFGNTVIGSFSYNVSAVPLPPALPMFGAAVLGLAVFGVGRRRKGAESAA